jgi:tetratricopeptide (TPR) repeat protein
MKDFFVWLATAATLTFALPVAGGQNDPALPALFAQLRAAPSAEAAGPIEERIWRLWTISGVDEIDQLMAVGLNAMAGREADLALAVFDEMVKRAPDFAEGWNKRATVHYMLGKFDESVADIEKTLALEPRHFGALSGLGLINLALDRDAAALEAFETALKIHPHMAGADSTIRELRDKVKGKDI